MSALTTIGDALEAAEEGLRTAIGDDGIFSLPDEVDAQAVFGTAEARVDVGVGARILASGDVDLLANATTAVSAIRDAGDAYLGLSYASAEPLALVRVFTGAVIEAAGDVDLRATTATTLTMRTEVSSNGDVVGISTSMGRTNAVSRVVTTAGSAITATNLTLFAENVRTISNVAIGGGFLDSGTAGVGAVLVVGFYVSNAAAALASRVVAAQDVVVDARSRELQNDSQAFGSVSDQPGGPTRAGSRTPRAPPPGAWTRRPTLTAAPSTRLAAASSRSARR